MNRFKCPACGGNQYTACDTAEGCIYCGHKGELEKMPEMEPEEGMKLEREKPDFIDALLAEEVFKV